MFSWHCKTQTQNFHSGRAPRVDFSQPLGATSPTSAPLHPLSAPIHTHTQRHTHTHTHTHPDMATERSLLAYLLLPLPNPFCVLSPQKFNEVTRRQCQFLSLSRQKSSASQHPKHPRHRAARRHPSCVQPSCHRLQMAASFFMLAQLRIQFRSVRWWRAAAFVHFALNIHRDPKRTKLLFCFGFCRQISRDFFVNVCVRVHLFRTLSTGQYQDLSPVFASDFSSGSCGAERTYLWLQLRVSYVPVYASVCLCVWRTGIPSLLLATIVIAVSVALATRRILDIFAAKLCDFFDSFSSRAGSLNAAPCDIGVKT